MSSDLDFWLPLHVSSAPPLRHLHHHLGGPSRLPPSKCPIGLTHSPPLRRWSWWQLHGPFLEPNHFKLVDFLANHIMLLWSSFAKSLTLPFCSVPTTVGVTLTYLALFLSVSILVLFLGAGLFFFRLLSLLVSKILLDLNMLVYFTVSYILSHFTP